MQNQQVNVDKGEYHTVFQMFDKQNTGQINIKEVTSLIDQLDGAQKSSALLTAPNDHPPPTTAFNHSTAGGVFTSSQLSQPNAGASAPSPSSPSSNIKSASITNHVSPPLSLGHTDKIVGATGAYMQGINTKSSNLTSGNNIQNKEEFNYGNHFPQRKFAPKFPNGKSSIKFDDFLGIIKETYQDKQLAQKHLLHTFSIFDREKKGYINAQDLRIIFQILGEKHPQQQIKAMIKIVGVLSNDKITFKQFKDFFYKQDQ